MKLYWKLTMCGPQGHYAVTQIETMDGSDDSAKLNQCVDFYAALTGQRIIIEECSSEAYADALPLADAFSLLWGKP